MVSSLCFLPPFSLPRFSSRPFRDRRRAQQVVRAKVSEVGSGVGGGVGGTAVVWLKHDLRVDDHLGFLNAVKEARTVVPVYVFDRRILSSFSDEMLELLLFALEDLRKLLKEQGSDLLIELGNAEDVILKLVNEVKATHIFVEEEVEYKICRVIDVVESSLSSVTFPWGDPKFVLWGTPFYDAKCLKELPASYYGFQKLKLACG